MRASCDVLIVGGGPAGSSCAWKLRQAGLDVLVLDRAEFPRDKVCAGWITPQVVDELALDCDHYRRGRTFQPITAFQTGLIGGSGEVATVYDRPVSFGIRRCEFDHYLLQRSGARLMLGAPLASLRRSGAGWIINDSVRAAMLVGAGGHFCPVARWLNPAAAGASLVVAQEAEFPVEPGTVSWTTECGVPELYYCPDLSGYGWCFRKQDYINIGLGRLNRRSLPNATAEFVAFLRARGKIPRSGSWRWRGHAYLVSQPPRRRAVDAGVLLVGDAAGLAYTKSGEGIRPAIESGLLAASAIVGAHGCYTHEQLEPYERQLSARFGTRADPELTRAISPRVVRTVEPSNAGGVKEAARSRRFGLFDTRRVYEDVRTALVPWLFERPWFVRNLLLDRWFLRADEPPLGN